MNKANKKQLVDEFEKYVRESDEDMTREEMQEQCAIICEHYHKTQMKEDIINAWIAGKETKEYGNTIFEDAEKYYKNNY